MAKKINHSEFKLGFLSLIENCVKIEINFIISDKKKIERKARLTVLNNQTPYFQDIIKFSKKYIKDNF